MKLSISKTTRMREDLEVLRKKKKKSLNIYISSTATEQKLDLPMKTV